MSRHISINIHNKLLTRNPRPETRNPAVLLALACLLLACGGSKVVQIDGPQVSGRVDADLETLLPSDEMLPGWTHIDKPRMYEPENLFDYVDGGAERYFDYGFKRVITAEYAKDKTAGMSFVLDIFDMGTPLGAFGIYSQARTGARRFLPIGGEAFMGPSNLEFWKGSCYVRLIAFSATPEIPPVLQAFAANVAARIPTEAPPPREITLFPPGALLDHSEQYLPKAALGIEGLDDCYMATYILDESRCELFIHQTKNEESVKQTLALIAKNAESAQESEGFLEVSLPYRGTGIVLADGNWIAMAIGDCTVTMKQALCLALQKRLPKP